MPIPTGFHRVRPEGSALVFTRTFKDSMTEVWASVTDPERSAHWFGFWTGDPADGFVMFTMNAEGEENATPLRYDLKRCEPPRVLHVTSDTDFGSWNLIVELEKSATGDTHFTLNHIITDPESVPSIGPGWEYYLDRLSTYLRGRNPDDVLWDDYYPALERHYVAIQQSLPREDASSVQ
ncbi:SRPBCC domain-containing protein [Granulicoccus sp. GXG6511]|uniref:SRPBCC domain-containing protein n=1 Tax=Granulicoccus sp. GXG6511 TaxID=3381351 RepID=UPI003D7E1C6C